MLDKAGCILIDKESKKVALIYRDYRDDYSFPKGHVEEGETPFETAVREFTEETSVILSNLDRITYLGLVRQNSRKKVHVFIKPYEDEDFTKLDSNECITVIDGVEYKHKEIASELNMPLGTVLYKYQVALEKIRKELK